MYKKLLLVNPGRNRIYGSNEPLNLAFLAAFIREKGFDVQIADELSGEDVALKARRFSPDIVGLTAASVLVADAFRLADYFRDKRIPTVMGGVHASVLPDDALLHADMVVRGEGEYALWDIMRQGCEKGVFQSHQAVDINAAPLPARDLLNNAYYLNVRRMFPQDGLFLFVPWRERLLSLMVSRGCLWRCAFCHNTWRGLPFRIFSAANVVREMETLRKNFNIRYALFRDDNIFSVRAKAKAILEGIISAGLGMFWGANARVDCLDDEILALAYKSGCRKLNFGFESGSQAVLDDLQKGTTVERVKKTVGLCRRSGIQVSGSFIVGHPGETAADVAATRSLIRQLRLDSMGVAMATPFPGTRWWAYAHERGLIPQKINWSLFDFDHVPVKLNSGFSVAAMKNIQRDYYREAFKANPRYFLKLVTAAVRNPAVVSRRIAGVLGTGATKGQTA